MNKYSILVVEDEALIAANLVNTLSSLGYEVHKPVAKGVDAILSVTTRKPDLVLMDIELSGVMNGIEAAEKIRAIADIPIVYLTVYTDDLHLKQAQLTEPYGYLVKPANSRDLHTTIEMAMYKHGLDQKLKESEERYYTLFNQSPIAIELYDAAGVLVHINQAGLNLFGIPDIQAIQQVSLFADPNIDDTQKEKIRQGENIQYQGAFDFEKVKTLNLYPTSRNGVIWLDVLITPLKKDDIALNGFLVQIQDITDRITIEKDLHESEIKHRTLFEAIADTIFLIDQKTGTIIDVNPAATTTYGFEHDEFIRMNAGDISAEPEQTAQAIENPVSYIPLRYHYHKDGTVFPVELTASTFELQGKTTIIAISKDITERKRIEDELSVIQSRLESAMETGGIAWWEMDCTSGNVIFNERKARMLGYPAEHFNHYTDFMSLVHPDDYEPLMQIMRDHLSGKTDQYDGDYRIRTRGGEYRWFYDAGRVSEYAPDGSPFKVSGLVIEITNRKQIWPPRNPPRHRQKRRSRNP